ncbi:MAG: hypothetical protein ISS45_02260 [Candidatus Omnitrophica bacterium]|nr:hypothetical protein [Candidatus Omnitrophota bacterium]
MSFKKCLKRDNQNLKGQSLIEYTLLVTISIVGLITANFIIQRLYDPDPIGKGAFEDHFETAATYITKQVF